MFLRSHRQLLAVWNCEESVRHIVRVCVGSNDRACWVNSDRMLANRGGKIDGRLCAGNSQGAVKYPGNVLKIAHDFAAD